MNHIRSILFKTASLCSVVVVAWLLGNYMCLLPAQESVTAASSVAERYMRPKTTERFLAIASGKQPVYPFDEIHTFDIRDGDRAVAKVQLYSFL